MCNACGMSPLRLRPLTLDDEDEFLAAHQNMMETDNWSLALNYDEGMAWADFVQRMLDFRLGKGLPEGLVRAAYLVADVEGVIVGRASLRFGLNEWLAHQGGHIGYGILAAHRRRGYATEILRQSLVITRSEGIASALVCCDDTNIGSATVIERCGGQLEGIVDGDHGPVRRYWV